MGTFYIAYIITLTFGAGMSGGVDIAPKKASWSTGWRSKKEIVTFVHKSLVCYLL